MGISKAEEQSTKPLSAWERRKLYSKNLSGKKIQPARRATDAVRSNKGDDKENSTSKKRRFTAAFSRDGNVDRNAGKSNPKRRKPDPAVGASTTKKQREPPRPSFSVTKASEKGHILSTARQSTLLVRPMTAKVGPRSSTATASATQKPNRNTTKPPVPASSSAGTGSASQTTSGSNHLLPKSQMQQQKDAKPEVVARKPTTNTSALKLAEKSKRRDPRKGSVAATTSRVASSKPTNVQKPSKSNLLPKTKKPVQNFLKNDDSKQQEQAKRAKPTIKVKGRSPRPIVTSCAVDKQVQDGETRGPGRKSIMKRTDGQTPAVGRSVKTQSKNNKVSFKSTAEVTLAVSPVFTPDSLEATPVPNTSSPNNSAGATPYRSMEEALPSSASSTEDEYHTPLVQKYALRKSAGGTPYRLPSAGTDDRLKKSAGSTPFRQNSGEDERPNEDEDPNGTFTLENESEDAEKDQQPSEFEKQEEKIRESVHRRPSCLRPDGGKQSRKSVSFVTAQRKQTPKPLSKTPQRNSSARADLESWLKTRGHSMSSYRHLHCFGLEEADLGRLSAKNARKQTPYVVSGSTKQPPRAANLGASPSLPAQSPKQEAASDDIASALKELHSLLKDGYPPTKVNAWIDVLENKVPDARSYVDYWRCRSLSNEKAGDFATAINWLVNGLDHVQTPNEELLEHLHELVEKISTKENLVPKAKKCEKKNRLTRQKALEVSPGNIFESTRLDYAVLEKDLIGRISMIATGKKSTPVAVLTPVRRSTRLRGDNVKVVEPSPAALLYKKNPALPSP